MLTQLKSYKEKVLSEIQSQYDQVQNIIIPEAISIKPFDVYDEIFKEKPADIQKMYNLPNSGNHVIYIMRILNRPVSNEKFKETIDKIKSIKKSNQYYTQITTINNTNLKYHLENYDREVTMYIGTSSSFSSRLKTHVGYGSKGTATVLLKEWPIFKNPDFKFSFDYFDFGKNISPESLKFFEYYFSQERRPLIGHNRRS